LARIQWPAGIDSATRKGLVEQRVSMTKGMLATLSAASRFIRVIKFEFCPGTAHKARWPSFSLDFFRLLM
jgi:hypothetical protein